MKLIKSNNSSKSLKGLHLSWGEHSYKGEKYRSYNLARSYREDGKNKKEIVIKLGKLSEDEVDSWRATLLAIKKGGPVVNLNDVTCTNNYDYLDVMIVNHYWNKWDLNSAFPGRGRRAIDIAEVAKILTINRCLDPCAKSQVPEWFKNSVLSLPMGKSADQLNASRIFRELDKIEDSKESLCSHIINKVRRDSPDSLSTVFFDLSTSKFYGNKSPLVNWGRAKEGYVHHVVLALLVTEDGLPLYWDVLEGGTHDIPTLGWLIRKTANRFPVKDITLVFDRGFVSDKNLKMLENESYKFISALDKSQLETSSNFDFNELTKLNPENINEKIDEILKPITKYDENTFVIEDLINDDDERRYILVFNSEMFIENQKARQKKIDEFKEYVNKMNRIIESAIKSRSRTFTEKKFTEELKRKGLEKYVKVKLDIKYMRTSRLGQVDRKRVFQAEAIIDEKIMSEEGRLDGFWMLVTNQTGGVTVNKFRLSSCDVIKAYRMKYKIEESFRDIKSSLDMAPVHVWTEKHIKAHYTICILAHLINRCISQDLAKNKGKRSKNIISANKLYNETQRCKLNKLQAPKTDKISMSFTKPSLITKDLLARLGLESLIAPAALRNIN